MVRNAGGRVLDAIRTFAVLQTIGSPGTIVVMHHTGMSSNPPPPGHSPALGLPLLIKS